MPAPDGGYLVMAENGLGGRVPEAFLALLDGAGAVAAGQFAEAEVALASTEPGAGGVLCLPWLAGSMAPAGSDTARGGLVGVSLATTRSQLIRATFEGVGHNLAWLLRHVEAFIGETIVELRLTGGGAEVAGWPQVVADVVKWRSPERRRCGRWLRFRTEARLRRSPLHQSRSCRPTRRLVRCTTVISGPSKPPSRPWGRSGTC